MTSFHEAGFAIIPEVISPTRAAELRAALRSLQEQTSQVSGGLRNLMSVSPEIKQLVSSKEVHRLVQPVLGDKFFPVRAILFDKTPEANWKVPWHQDVTIAVKQRVETAGYSPGRSRQESSMYNRPLTSLNKWFQYACTWTTAPPGMERSASSPVLIGTASSLSMK